jgi:DNA topoisomerase I
MGLRDAFGLGMSPTRERPPLRESNAPIRTPTAIRLPRLLRRRVLPKDPRESSKLAGLRYVSDCAAGITRHRAGRGFYYLDSSGNRVTDKEVLVRIRSLVIPPAWERVWICPSPTGHLQAVGYDARGRKQYRYHQQYRQVRDQTKFERLPAFAAALPAIRARVDAHLALPGLPRDKVLATVVRLLETTMMRVGNREYAEENHSFGLTTLRNRHVEVSGSTLRLRFVGKSGVAHDLEVNDHRVARIVKQCHDLPGHHLFQYVDKTGELRSVNSDDVNAYLKEISGNELTSKDFRTWAGTVECALALQDIGGFSTQKEAKSNVTAAIRAVAQKLGNRPATCRAYYVHPAIPEAYLDGSLPRIMEKTDAAAAETQPLKPHEIAVLRVLAMQSKNRAVA